MGLDRNGLQFVLFAQKTGVDFENTATIGRQRLDISYFETRKLLKAYGYTVNRQIINSIFTENNGFSEPLLKYIGAKEIHSFDASAYEGASHLHDMNEGIPPNYIEKYSVVLDGGSLEHIFNLPIAIKNCMEMIKVGGHYLGITPANNFMGHGFYQFSPELYFNIFTPQNGFEVIHLIAFEDKPGSIWYEVKNPKEIKKRVLLINSESVYLLIIARKNSRSPIFSSPPQQSDYVSMWGKENEGSKKSITARFFSHTKEKSSIWIKNYLPFFLYHLIRSLVLGHGFNHNFFTPINPFPTKDINKK